MLDPRRSKTLLIGIAGGIASGKSFVSQQLERRGAAVISADAAAHGVLELDEVKHLARQRWGEAIFDDQGQVDRSRLAKIVFAPPPDGPRELEYLEQLTHPRVGDVMGRQLAELAQRDNLPAVVLDVPLLFESDWHKLCDKIVFVDAPPEVRAARAAARGWTREDFARREAAQQSPDLKRSLADIVIDNAGSQSATEAQVERLWQSLAESPPAE